MLYAESTNKCNNKNYMQTLLIYTKTHPLYIKKAIIHAHMTVIIIVSDVNTSNIRIVI